MGYVFHVSGDIDLKYYESLVKVTPRIRSSRKVVLGLIEEGRVAPLDAIVYFDPANTVSANMGSRHTDAEKLKYIKGMDELLSMGTPPDHVDRIFQELYTGKTKETGVNAAGGLLTLGMICPQEKLGLRKDDMRRMGSMGFDLSVATRLEDWKRAGMAAAEARRRQINARVIPTPSAEDTPRVHHAGVNGA